MKPEFQIGGDKSEPMKPEFQIGGDKSEWACPCKIQSFGYL